MLTFFINNEKYLALYIFLSNEPNFIFTFLVKSFTTNICPNFLGKVTNKTTTFLSQRHNLETRYQVSTSVFLPLVTLLHNSLNITYPQDLHNGFDIRYTQDLNGGLCRQPKGTRWLRLVTHGVCVCVCVCVWSGC